MRPHGVRAKYVSEGCRCDPCREANRLYNRARDKRLRQERYGLAAPVLVDSAEVRAHIDTLRAAGIGWRRVAQLSGVSTGTLGRLVGYNKTRPARRVRTETARAILAVPATSDMLAGKHLIAGGVAGRKIRALIAAGYPRSILGQHLGITNTNFTRYPRLDDSQLLTSGTNARINQLYRQLSPHPGPSARARNEGQRKGWPPPLAWDDIDHDILADDTDVEGCAICDDIEHLAFMGETPATIKTRLGLPGKSSMTKHLLRHDRADLVERLAAS